MIDLTNIRQVDLIVYGPDGNKTTVTKYVNIDTNEEVDASLINGQKVEKITLSCSNICVV
jgi:hypothetical protein